MNDKTTYEYADYEHAADIIRQRSHKQPSVGLVLGSGLGTLADTLEDATAIAYEDIPGWPTSTVVGHAGKLVIGTLEGRVVAAQQGRAHFYEGYSMQQVTFPIRVMKLLGIDTVILTNAAGGIDQSYRAGDLMMISDHINPLGMVGFSPLHGPNDERFGPRFPPLVHTYDADLRRAAREAAVQDDIPLHEGVYVSLSGPTYETPAEIRMLRGWGADAVGMSTTHEVVAAAHAGMRVFACSGITNEAIDTIDTSDDVNHEDVLELGKVIVPRLTQILRAVLRAV